MADISGMMTSDRQDWSTPQWFFDLLDGVVGGFNLDPCATPITAKCKRYFTPEHDGLSRSWVFHPRTKAFVNSEYGHELPKWVRKCYEEYKAGCDVVQLLPARTETAYFQDFAPQARVIWFPRKRLQFLLPCAAINCNILTRKLYKLEGRKKSLPFCDNHAPKDIKGKNSSTFPSAVLFFTHEDYNLDPLRNRGVVIEANGYNPLLQTDKNEFYRNRTTVMARLFRAIGMHLAVNMDNGYHWHETFDTDALLSVGDDDKDAIWDELTLAGIEAAQLLSDLEDMKWMEKPGEFGPLWRTYST